MRDLKYLIEFEDLLQEANNALVRQAKEEGRLALGYTCYFMPEVLLDLPGCFGVRLRAPRSSSPDIASYYMSNRSCPYARSLLERAIEGGYHFLDAQFATETCTATNRFQEHLEILKLVDNPDFFVSFMDVPHKKGVRSNEDHYADQLRMYVLDPMREKLGVNTSDEALRAAIEEHNELCRIISEIGNLRKLPNPPITGYEFHVINLVSLVCPKYLIMDKLKETLDELKKREPDAKPAWKVRVVLAGSENDDPEFTRLIESCGALVVADRHCYGSLPGREPIEIKDGETPLYAIARHYLEHSECPRYMNTEVVHGRKRYLKKLYEDYHADGVILEQMKFCEYWSYERVADSLILTGDYGIPCCSIEKDYNNNAFGQLRTRFQAFVESLEIKKIQKGAGRS